MARNAKQAIIRVGGKIWNLVFDFIFSGIQYLLFGVLTHISVEFAKRPKYQIFKNCLKVGSAKFGDIFVGDYILTSETLVPL